MELTVLTPNLLIDTSGNIFPPFFVVKTPIAIHISSKENVCHCSLISGLSSNKDLHSFPIAILSNDPNFRHTFHTLTNVL